MSGAALGERHHSRIPLAPVAGAYAALAVAGLVLAAAALQLAGAPAPLLLPLMAVGAGVALVVTVAEPRWALIVVVFLLVGFFLDRAGRELGFLDGVYRFGPLIVGVVLLRRIFLAKPVPVPPALLGLLGLLAAALMSTFGATDLEVSLERLGDLVRVLTIVGLMVVLLDSPAWLRRAMWAVALAAAILAALAVYQQVTRSFDSNFLGLAEVGEGPPVRSQGPLNAVFFAQFLATSAMLALYLSIAGRTRMGKLLALACFGLCLTAIAYTASRGPVLAVCCALALVAVLRPRHVLLPLLALVIALAVTVPRLSEDYLDRFQSLASVAAAPSTQAVTSAPEDSLESRLAEYIAALQMFADHPFLGVGYGNYPVRYLDYAEGIGLEKKPGPRTPHSLVLEALSETGVVGTVALLSVLGAAFAGAWRARSVLDPHGAALAEGTFVALAAFVVASLFLHAATLRWVLVPVGLALAAGQIGRTASASGRAAGVR